MLHTITRALSAQGLHENELLAIGLLQEELKAQRFYHDLEQVGFDDNYFRPNLSFYILSFAGFPLHHQNDALLERYYAIVTEQMVALEPTASAVHAAAVHVYRKLMLERKRRRGAGDKQKKGAG